ncbi:hypothetical protein ACWJJH_18150 [Endozoicomonadaceae bacterium StTr2]
MKLACSFLVCLMLFGMEVAQAAGGLKKDSFPQGKTEIAFKDKNTDEIRVLTLTTEDQRTDECCLMWALKKGDDIPVESGVVRQAETWTQDDDTKPLEGSIKIGVIPPPPPPIHNVETLTTDQPPVTSPPAHQIRASGGEERTVRGCGLCDWIFRRGRSTVVEGNEQNDIMEMVAVSGSKKSSLPASSKSPAGRSLTADKHHQYVDIFEVSAKYDPILKTCCVPSFPRSAGFAYQFEMTHVQEKLMPLLIVSQLIFSSEIGPGNLKQRASLQIAEKRVIRLVYEHGPVLTITLPYARNRKLLIEYKKTTTDQSSIVLFTSWDRQSESKRKGYTPVPFFINQAIAEQDFIKET